MRWGRYRRIGITPFGSVCKIVIDLRGVVAGDGRRCVDECLQQIRLDLVNLRGVGVDAVDDVFHMGCIQPQNPVTHQRIRVGVMAEGEG